MKVLIMRLSPFRDVVKSTPHQFLYGECARVLPDEDIDFVFLPNAAERERLSTLRGLRTGLEASKFDLILVSNSYAVELVNLPSMLRYAHIPYRHSQRVPDASAPLIVMGGSNAMASQGVLYSADDAFVDALYFGEGEGNTTRLVSALLKTPRNQWRQVLSSLEGEIDGLMVVGNSHTSVRKAILPDTSHDWLSTARQYLFDSPEATTARLQISYGCPYFCTFCFEGWERKPYREVPYEELERAARQLKRATGSDTLEITSFNFNTHHDVVRLMGGLNKFFFRVNFMSQRADILAAHPELLPFEVAGDKRQFTIGVEGISERMRAYFHKNLDRQTFLKVLDQMLSQNIREVKLFFILSGLEEDEDVADFQRLLESIKKVREKRNRGIRILCSFGLLVRMPFTPLRYAPLLLREELWEPVVEKVKRATEQGGYEFRLTYPYKEYFLSQALVMTNQHVAPALEAMADAALVYDGSLPEGAWELFEELFPVTEDLTREKPEDWPFAYGFVDCGIPSKVLYSRYVDAKEGRQHSTCMGGNCQGCGACDQRQRETLASHTISMPGMMDGRALETLMKAKAQAKPFFVKMEIPEQYTTAYKETKAAYVMRTLMQAINQGEEAIMTVRDAGFDSLEMMRWWGDNWYAVYPFSNDRRGEVVRALGKAGFAVCETVPAQNSLQVEIVGEREQLDKAARRLLDGMHIPYILGKNGGKSLYGIPPKFLKKHIVESCIVQGNVLRLEGTSKIQFSPLAHSGLVAHIKQA